MSAGWTERHSWLYGPELPRDDPARFNCLGCGAKLADPIHYTDHEEELIAAGCAPTATNTEFRIHVTAQRLEGELGGSLEVWRRVLEGVLALGEELAFAEGWPHHGPAARTVPYEASERATAAAGPGASQRSGADPELHQVDGEPL